MRKYFNTFLSKTIMFIVVIGIVLVCKKVFGPDNVVAAIGMIIQALFFLSSDLTMEPVKNFFKILAADLLLGFCAAAVHLDPWLGLAVNLILIFGVIFIFMKDLSTPMYFPFMLTYLFMMATAPIGISELPPRLALLAFGAFMTIVLQLILNIGKSKNKTNTDFCALADMLIEKAETTGKEKPDVSKKIREVARIINDRKKSSFFMSKASLDKISIVTCIERMDLILDEIPAPDGFCEIMKSFKEYINDDSIDYPEKTDLFIAGYENRAEEQYQLYELLEVMDVLKRSACNLKEKRKNKVRGVIKKGKKPKEYRMWHIFKENFTPDSIRFSFAFRAAVGISAAWFVTDFFDMQHGRWIMFSMFAIIQPYASEARSKMLSRIRGTAIGFAAYLVLFNVFHTALAYSIIFMVVGYVFSYIKDYGNQTIFVTITSMGMASMAAGSAADVVWARPLFVVIGGCAALLLNRFCFHCTVAGTTAQLQHRYFDVAVALFRELFGKDGKDIDENHVANILLASNLIEDKIQLNNTTLEDPKIDEFIKYDRMLINDIMYLSYGRMKGGLPGSVKSITDKLVQGREYDRISSEIEMKFKETDLSSCKTQLVALQDIVQESRHLKSMMES
ncbi:MAG: FUSC family protein [Eubacteriaceae bacterium]|nr:FUSC family protein [Eubacteriaceae bacterium]